jgi:predicted nucleic acid-binding protein
VRPSGLIDTGAILALLDVTERWHGACVAAYDQIRLPLATTSAVLAETFYFTVKRNLMPRTWEFIRAAPLVIAPITNEEFPSLEALMHRYADRPMDFADATLVHVAEREGLNTILTIDHDDFETYRIGRNAKFRILPARAR